MFFYLKVTEQIQPLEENPLDNIFKTIKKIESEQKSLEAIPDPNANPLQSSNESKTEFSFSKYKHLL